MLDMKIIPKNLGTQNQISLDKIYTFPPSIHAKLYNKQMNFKYTSIH
jgi:hypothetical protein